MYCPSGDHAVKPYSFCSGSVQVVSLLVCTFQILSVDAPPPSGAVDEPKAMFTPSGDHATSPAPVGTSCTIATSQVDVSYTLTRPISVSEYPFASVAMYLPSGDQAIIPGNATLVASSLGFMCATLYQVVVSQMSTSSPGSAEIVARYLLSGDQVTPVTLPGKVSWWMVCLDATSQMRTDISVEAEASSLPPGDQVTLSTQKPCPLSLSSSFGGGV
jgi:hypothetical protein